MEVTLGCTCPSSGIMYVTESHKILVLFLIPNPYNSWNLPIKQAEQYWALNSFDSPTNSSDCVHVIHTMHP